MHGNQRCQILFKEPKDNPPLKNDKLFAKQPSISFGQGRARSGRAIHPESFRGRLWPCPGVWPRPGATIIAAPFRWGERPREPFVVGATFVSSFPSLSSVQNPLFPQKQTKETKNDRKASIHDGETLVAHDLLTHDEVALWQLPVPPVSLRSLRYLLFNFFHRSKRRKQRTTGKQVKNFPSPGFSSFPSFPSVQVFSTEANEGNKEKKPLPTQTTWLPEFCKAWPHLSVCASLRL